MLSLGKLSLGQEAYYLTEVLEGAEDYYLNAGEAPGRWVGRGAATLGLGGSVSAEELRAVLSGRRPDGSPLRETAAALPGIDVTLKAPKSVSLVWGLGDAATADAVVVCHEAAVDAALGYLEHSACKVRRGRGGAVVMEADGFTAAAFRHRTSRAGDPALHTHVLVANLAPGPDGRWTALDTRQLYAHGRTAGFIYQAVLRHELARRLGLLFEEVERGYADVAGVPKGLRRAFSARRAQIVAAMERHGSTSARAAQIAALETREAKTDLVPESELRRRWAERARPFGWDLDQLPRLVRDPTMDADDADVAARVTESDATFTRRDLLRAVAQAATQGASLEAIEDRADAFLESDFAVTVGLGRWTTPEILALERRSVEAAAAGRGAGVGVVEPSAVATALAARPSLGADQHWAVETLTTSGDAVQIMIGPAGTGKTFCLDAAREAWEAAGYRVIGTALAARAAAELQADAAIPSQTADRLLRRLAQGQLGLDGRSVVVCDEGAMLGTRRLAALVDEARASGAKLVLVGDPRQLPEIDAGGLFSSLAERLGPVELVTNRRQRDPEERAAAAELRAREIDAALDRLVRHERVSSASNSDLLRDAMVADWYEACARGQQALMVASRRSAVADLNERARTRLVAAGELGEEVMSTGELSFAVADQVVAGRNDYRLGVLNGQRGVVRSGSEDALQVDFGNGRVVDVPAGYVAAGHLSHGYATTLHKAQGLTCDRALVLGDDGFDVESGYTALTRGREENRVYLVVPERADSHGQEIERDPVAHFRTSLARSGAKTAAVDYLEPPVVGR